MVNAEELGVTQRNVDDMMKSDAPDIRRLLGVEGQFGQSLGLDQRLGLSHHQGGRQLRRKLRAQCRPRLAVEDRARPERAVDQGRLAIRAAGPLNSAGCRRRRGHVEDAAIPGSRNGHGQHCAAVGARRCRRRPAYAAARQCRAKSRAMPRSLPAFGFWDNTAGFDISQTLIAYSSSTSTFGRAFWVGLLNTLLVAGSASCWRPCSASPSASHGCRAIGWCRSSPAATSN